jgi:hypothetical protein
MIVVFDTCTQPEYRRDLHRLLALPPGAILQYQYDRRLISTDAATQLENFSPRKKALPTLLLYGQTHAYLPGASDKGLPMLTWESAVFVPTRSAVIVNVHIERASDPKRDVFHFDLRLKGFVDPANREIEQLIKHLQERDCLPFGDREAQYIWVSSVEENPNNPISTSMLVTDQQSAWTDVVHVLCSPRTQFDKDIFWRITGVQEIGSKGDIDVALYDRPANRWGQLNWHRDYLVYQRRKYRIEYQTYQPTHEDKVYPGNATIALIPDDPDGLILVGTTPTTVRPNQTSTVSFSTADNATLRDSFTQLEVVTQIADWPETRFDPGSRCTLTLRITKWKPGLAWAVLFAVLTIVFGALASAIKHETHVILTVVLAILTAVCGLAAYYFWKGKIRDSK